MGRVLHRSSTSTEPSAWETEAENSESEMLRRSFLSTFVDRSSTDAREEMRGPRPVGDKVKTAIARASRRLGFSNSRTTDLWYGEAKRIDAQEMDRLRICAQQAEISTAIACIEILTNQILTSRSTSSTEVINALAQALEICLNAEQARNPLAKAHP